MKVAIPVWQNRVAPVFDTCNQIKIFDSEKQLSHLKTVEIGKMSLANRLNAISDSGTEILVCNGISNFLAGCLQARSIRVLNNLTGHEREVLNLINYYLFKEK